MTLPTIAPKEAAQKIQQGAQLIDIREANEYRREHIAQAHHLALSELATAPQAASGNKVLIFHCKSGIRTQQASVQLAAYADSRQAFLLENGIEGWKKAGLPTETDKKQPLEMMRQVQIAAGYLVLLGVLLGSLLSPAFYLIAGFVGAGLMFAGISGFCGMARLLAVMPWNRR